MFKAVMSAKGTEPAPNTVTGGVPQSPTESHWRTLAKTISWRMVATVLTAGVVLAFTGKSEMAFSIALSDTLIKLATYYFHERIWSKVSLGYSCNRRT